MALNPGTRLGVYQITALLGEGGMGQVYRARDTKLDRDVAIKVLPEAFAQDADRLARFTREAKTLAALNHPHIAAIYGLEDADGTKALVMELVEGDDLSQRIARGAIPLDEALPIAKQIAEALEAAHEQGIVHRDLKPANIKVRADGTVKVLDFGLAKALDTRPASATADNSPTITTPAMTQAGMILGTAAYMSPEQARGKVVDKRADIWAFGAVLFEMLTGRRAFTGEGVTDTIVSVVGKEPDWRALPATTPAGLRQLLTRCLKKDAKARLQAIGDARVQIDEVLSGTHEGAPSATTVDAELSAARGRRPWIAAFAVAAALAVALAVPAARYLGQAPPPPPPETRTDIVTSATDDAASFALSPDGRQIVYLASGDDGSRLWLRSLATTTPTPLGGTLGARLPFWSPNGRSIGFFSRGQLMRLDLDGGTPQALAPATNGSGGTWNDDGVIVYAPSLTTGLMRVSATGGAAVAVTTSSAISKVGPQFLPDGRRFLFFERGAASTGAAGSISLGSLDGAAPTQLTPSDAAGVYLPSVPGLTDPTSLAERATSGWLVWVRAGSQTLVAQRLDLVKLALTGEPVTVADGVGHVSAAATGLLAYRSGGSIQRQLTWVDRSGTTQGTVGDPDGTYLGPRVSRDRRRVVVMRTVQNNQDLWLLDGTRTSRLTFDANAEMRPVWSPDGTQVMFRMGEGLYQKRTSGAGEPELVHSSDQTKSATSWSANGRFVLYHSQDPQSDSDLWAVPMLGDRTPWMFLKSAFRELHADFSPDGRWVTYESNESGRFEVYVRPFVPPSPDVAANSAAAAASTSVAGGQWQVSTTGGVFPAWQPDGKALYYLNPAGSMMAVPITVSGATLEPGVPVALFPARILGGGVDAQQGRQYDVASDGRFLINRVLDSAVAPITLVQNWQPEVKK